MAVQIDCGKVNPSAGCEHVIRAETDEEALQHASEHVMREHRLQLTSELFLNLKEHIERV